MELSDGRCNRLCGSAAGDLLFIPQKNEQWPYHGGRQGLARWRAFFWKGKPMTKLTRRRAIAGLGAAAAAAAKPFRSAKAADAVTVWWTQGFYEAENKAVIDNLA